VFPMHQFKGPGIEKIEVEGGKVDCCQVNLPAMVVQWT